VELNQTLELYSIEAHSSSNGWKNLDFELRVTKKKSRGRVCIGWTGLLSRRLWR
jgi:hypothetical protein